MLTGSKASDCSSDLAARLLKTPSYEPPNAPVSRGFFAVNRVHCCSAFSMPSCSIFLSPSESFLKGNMHHRLPDNSAVVASAKRSANQHKRLSFATLDVHGKGQDNRAMASSKSRQEDRFIRSSTAIRGSILTKAAACTRPEPYANALYDALGLKSTILSNAPRTVSVARKPLLSEADKYILQRKADISTHPVRVLQAPNLVDDFYLNILDWGLADVMAIALCETTYLWNARTEVVAEVGHCKLFPGQPVDYISALKFMPNGRSLLAASPSGRLASFDVLTGKSSSLGSHDHGRVVSISAMDNSFAAGARAGVISLHDMRSKTPIHVLSGAHRLEVCGLQVSPSSLYLASGGNDNRVVIWDLRTLRPIHRQHDHLAAVKALAWCPWKEHLLATGSGTADKRIRIWNTVNNACVLSMCTSSQVCSLHWSTACSELVSCHGYLDNELVVWHYPSMRPIAKVHAHASRILQSCQSADCTTIATAATDDEQLKLWSIFPACRGLRKPSRRLYLRGAAIS